jgi:hypothetical protein
MEAQFVLLGSAPVDDVAELVIDHLKELSVIDWALQLDRVDGRRVSESSHREPVLRPPEIRQDMHFVESLLIQQSLKWPFTLRAPRR